MKKASILAGVMSCAVMSAAVLSTTAAEETTEFATLTQSTGEGATLYKIHGCVNCHGEDGNKPAADIFPTLSGKDSAHLLKQMESIQSGERSGGDTAIMHQQYYAEETASEACDEAPTQAELKHIADWLATR